MTKRNVLRVILSVLLLLVLTFFALVAALDLGAFHDSLERQMAAASGGKVELGSLFVPPLWPFSLNVGPTEIENDSLKLHVQHLTVSVVFPLPPFQVHMTLEEPKLELKTAPESRAETPPPKPSASASHVAIPLGVRLSLQRGEVKTSAAELHELNVEFSQRLLFTSQAKLRLDAGVALASFPLNLPLHAESDDLILTNETYGAKSLRISLSGLSVALSGEGRRDGLRQQWKIDSDVADLSTLPEPPTEDRVKHWRGALKVSGHVTKDPSGPLSVQLAAELKDGHAELNVKHESLTLRGPLNVAFALEADGPLAKLSVPKFDLLADLTEAECSWPHLFLKPRSMPLRMTVHAVGDRQEVHLESAKLELWKAVVLSSGRVDLVTPSNTSIEATLAPLNLKGLEKVVLALAEQPVQGELSFKALYQGALSDPKAGHVQLNPLVLKKFGATVSYDRPGSIKARGPVRLDLKSHLDWAKGALKEVEATGQVDLSPTALTLGPLRKEAGQSFAGEFNLVQSANSVQIRKASLNTYLGKADLTGNVRDFKRPDLKLKLNLHSLNLTEIRLALPQYHDLVPGGEASANLSFEGQVGDFSKWWTWPMVIEGGAKVKLAKYEYVKKPEPAKPDPAAPPSPTEPPKPLLPSGELTKRLNVKIQVQADSVGINGLSLKDLGADTQIASGHLRGKIHVGQVFEGQAQLSNLDVPLLDIHPKLSGQATWKQIAIASALAYASPKSRDLASGLTAGQIEFVTLSPSEPGAVATAQAKGQITADPVTLNSVKIGQIVNDLTKQVPALKIAPMKVAPMKGNLHAQIQLAHQIVDVESFTAHDEGGSDLKMAGKVLLKPDRLDGDLVGNLYLAHPPLAGCALEGNSDAEGRLALPLQIKGDLMHPGMNVLSDIITQLGSKALACEGRKLLEKVQKDGGKKLQEDLQKGLQDLFGH